MASNGLDVNLLERRDRAASDMMEDALQTLDNFMEGSLAGTCYNSCIYFCPPIVFC